MAEKKNVSVKVYNMAGEEVSKMNLSAAVFGIEPHQQAMFDAVQVEQANQRQATAKTKVRHEVSGGGKKPWRQKGTGRARAGSSRSPVWVGGGTVFGPITAIAVRITPKPILDIYLSVMKYSVRDLCLSIMSAS